MFKKNNDLGDVVEVSVCSFVNVPNDYSEPINTIEIDPNSIKTMLCIIRGEQAIDKYGMPYHILQRDINGRIKSSEGKKIQRKKLYVTEINYRKKISKSEQREFYRELKKRLSANKNYNFESDNTKKNNRIK